MNVPKIENVSNSSISKGNIRLQLIYANPVVKETLTFGSLTPQE